MQVKQNINIHNRFDIEVRDTRTGRMKQRATAYNIVLDQMYTRLCGGSNYFANIHFGTGVGEINPSRTSLFTHLGTKAAILDELIKAVPVSKWKQKIVLNPEEYVGAIITETGIAFGSSASNLVTHALLKDSEGNPISINKTNTDVVTIYATVFITFSNTIPELILTGVPSSNQLINYLTGGSAPSGSFGVTEMPNGYKWLGSTPHVTWISDTVNRQRKTNISRFGVAEGNGNIKTLEFSSLFSLELPANGIFSGQPYVGINVGVGDGVQKVFDLPSANIRNTSIVIKKNGVIDNALQKRVVPFFASRRANPSSPPGADARGVALTPDGLTMAVSSYYSPYIATYDWVDGAWVRRANPSSPIAKARGVALTPDGLTMAVASSSSPYIATYDWVDGAWVRRANPSSLPGAGVRGVALTPDGLTMAVSSGSSYDWVDGAWVRRADPSSRPGGDAYEVALTPDGLTMVVASYDSPYIATYDWADGAWVRRATPSSLPDGTAYGVDLTPDGLTMAVAFGSSPYIVTYDWVDGAWVRRTNPSFRPDGTAYGVALTPDGLTMAVSSYDSPYIATYDNMPKTLIEFTTPPAVGEVITADYTVDGIHKTNQYVIDASFAIQFGEGV